MCVLPDIYSGRQTFGLTSRGHTGGRSHRISPSFFCGACLNFYREKVSVVPSSTVKSNFVYPRINRSRLVGHVFKEKPWGKKIVCVFFCEEKSQFVQYKYHYATNDASSVSGGKSYDLQRK